MGRPLLLRCAATVVAPETPAHLFELGWRRGAFTRDSPYVVREEDGGPSTLGWGSFGQVCVRKVAGVRVAGAVRAGCQPCLRWRRWRGAGVVEGPAPGVPLAPE